MAKLLLFCCLTVFLSLCMFALLPLKLFFYFKEFFFLRWTILKVIMEFVTILLLFSVSLFLEMRHVRFSFPTKNQSSTLALEGEVQTTGPPGKSLNLSLKFLYGHRQLEDVWSRGWRVSHRGPLGYSGNADWCGHCGKQYGGFSENQK